MPDQQNNGLPQYPNASAGPVNMVSPTPMGYMNPQQMQMLYAELLRQRYTQQGGTPVLSWWQVAGDAANKLVQQMQLNRLQNQSAQQWQDMMRMFQGGQQGGGNITAPSLPPMGGGSNEPTPEHQVPPSLEQTPQISSGGGGGGGGGGGLLHGLMGGGGMGGGGKPGGAPPGGGMFGGGPSPMNVSQPPSSPPMQGPPPTSPPMQGPPPTPPPTPPPAQTPGQGFFNRNMPAGPQPAASLGGPDVSQSPALAAARANFAQELQNPAVRDKLFAITQAEVGNNPASQQMLMESILNRAASRGLTIDETISPHYYQPMMNRGVPGDNTFGHFLGGLTDDTRTSMGGILDNVMQGSNTSNFATGNGSGSVVGFNRGVRTAESPSREHFGIEGPDLRWVNSIRSGATQNPKAPAQAPAQPQPQQNFGPLGQGPLPPGATDSTGASIVSGTKYPVAASEPFDINKVTRAGFGTGTQAGSGANIPVRPALPQTPPPTPAAPNNVRSMVSALTGTPVQYPNIGGLPPEGSIPGTPGAGLPFAPPPPPAPANSLPPPATSPPPPTPAPTGVLPQPPGPNFGTPTPTPVPTQQFGAPAGAPATPPPALTGPKPQITPAATPGPQGAMPAPAAPAPTTPAPAPTPAPTAQGQPGQASVYGQPSDPNSRYKGITVPEAKTVPPPQTFIPPNDAARQQYQADLDRLRQMPDNLQQMTMGPNGPSVSWVRNPEKIQLAQKLQDELSKVETLPAKDNNGYAFTGNSLQGYKWNGAPRTQDEEAVKAHQNELNGIRGFGDVADQNRQLVQEAQALYRQGVKGGWGAEWQLNARQFVARWDPTGQFSGFASGQELLKKTFSMMKLGFTNAMRDQGVEAGTPAGRMFTQQIKQIDDADGQLTNSDEGNYALLEQRSREFEKGQITRDAANEYASAHGGRLDDAFSTARGKWTAAPENKTLTPAEEEDRSLLVKDLRQSQKSSEGQGGTTQVGAAIKEALMPNVGTAAPSQLDPRTGAQVPGRWMIPGQGIPQGLPQGRPEDWLNAGKIAGETYLGARTPFIGGAISRAVTGGAPTVDAAAQMSPQVQNIIRNLQATGPTSQIAPPPAASTHAMVEALKNVGGPVAKKILDWGLGATMFRMLGGH